MQHARRARNWRPWIALKRLPLMSIRNLPRHHLLLLSTTTWTTPCYPTPAGETPPAQSHVRRGRYPRLMCRSPIRHSAEAETRPVKDR
jgi:hypothetical protein